MRHAVNIGERCGVRIDIKNKAGFEKQMLLYVIRLPASGAVMLGTTMTVGCEGLPVLVWSVPDKKLVFY